jgi:hypothetical protein
MNLDLDLDWVDYQQRILCIENKSSREPMSSISILFVYLNLDSMIDTVITEKISLSILPEENRSVLKKEALLKLIQEKKISTFLKKYIFQDILVYNIDIESHRIPSFTEHSETYPSFLQTILLPDDIYLEPSIFIFHPLNTIYVFFKEVEKKMILHPKPLLRLSFEKNSFEKNSFEKKSILPIHPKNISLYADRCKTKKYISILPNRAINNTTRKNINK